YNFDVQEKDLSGMWAMQAQMQPMPSPPEPSDEQIKDAIWIVLNFPTAQQQPGMPSTPIGPKVAEHLKNGGSALILFAPQADNPMAENMNDLMKEWGMEVHPEAIAVHQLIKTTEGRQVDMIEDALKYPFVFDIRDYGNHLITNPLRSLASMFLPLSPVKVADKPPAGVKVTPIIPLP